MTYLVSISSINRILRNAGDQYKTFMQLKSFEIIGLYRDKIIF
jgi:hypothetical protein